MYSRCTLNAGLSLSGLPSCPKHKYKRIVYGAYRQQVCVRVRQLFMTLPFDIHRPGEHQGRRKVIDALIINDPKSRACDLGMTTLTTVRWGTRSHIDTESWVSRKRSTNRVSDNWKDNGTTDEGCAEAQAGSKRFCIPPQTSESPLLTHKFVDKSFWLLPLDIIYIAFRMWIPSTIRSSISKKQTDLKILIYSFHQFFVNKL
jgi:hypothetical protein